MNCLCPGLVETKIVTEDQKDASHHPPKEMWMKPEEIAASFKTLVSGDGNGAVLLVLSKDVPPIYWPDVALPQVYALGAASVITDKWMRALTGRKLEYFGAKHMVTLVAVLVASLCFIGVIAARIFL